VSKLAVYTKSASTGYIMLAAMETVAVANRARTSSSNVVLTNFQGRVHANSNAAVIMNVKFVVVGENVWVAV